MTSHRASDTRSCANTYCPCAARLTAKSKQNQQLAEKVAKLEADVSRLKGQSLQELAGLQSCLDSSLEHLRLSRAELEAMSAQTQARFEREAEHHAEVVQQLQQQRDREARAHREELTTLRDLLEVAHPAKSHTSELHCLTLSPLLCRDLPPDRASLVSLCRLEQRSLTSTTSDFPSHGALDSTVLPGTQESTPPGGATEATATLSTPEFTDTVDQSEEALLPA
ncbi:TPA: hypothetical protein ACH3X1_000435 [Trebouxia sp. C0004]